MNNMIYWIGLVVIIFMIMILYSYFKDKNKEDDMNVSTKNFMKSIKHYKFDQENTVENSGIMKKNQDEQKQNKKIFIHKPIQWVLAGSYEEETLKIQKKEFLNDKNIVPINIDKNKKNPTILCIDDSITSLKMIERILKANNMDYILKDNGWDGLEYLKDSSNEKPDIIISDIEMPKINGIELIQIIRKDKRYQNIPIILVSSFPEAHIELLEKELIQGFILKPFNEQDLLQQIKYLLNKQ